MNKSFGNPDNNPDTSPRYQRAAIQARALSTHGGRVWLAAAVLLIASWATGAFAPASIWPTFFGCNAAALMLFATGLRSAIEVADWRRRKAGLSSLAAPAWSQHLRGLLLRPWNTTEPGDGPSHDRIERLSGKIAMLAASSIHRLGARAASLAALAILSMLVAFDTLSWVAQPFFLGPMAYTISGLCLVLAFGLLVVERGFAAADADEWPEAQSLMLLARLPIVTLSLSAFSCCWWAPAISGPSRCRPCLPSCRYWWDWSFSCAPSLRCSARRAMNGRRNCLPRAYLPASCAGRHAR